MIGLAVLGALVLWIAAAGWLAGRVPIWLNIERHTLWVSPALFISFVCLPFVDHWVGMRQFEKLCTEQTSLTIYPGAADAKRGAWTISDSQRLDGYYFVEIQRSKVALINVETNQAVLSYDRFWTKGSFFRRMTLNGPKQCSASDRDHPDQKNYRKVTEKITVSYGADK